MEKLAILLAALAFGGPAFAADMAVKAPVNASPPLVPTYNWTGWYVGLNAGAEWGTDPVDTVGIPGPCTSGAGACTATPNYSTTAAQAATFSASAGSRARLIGGGQIGYNWQVSSYIAGLEADIQGLGRSSDSTTLISSTPNSAFPGYPVVQTATVTKQLNYLDTLRGRVGELFTPTFLGYATGGLAYGAVKTSTSLAQTFDNLPAAAAGSVSTTRPGWTAGGGFEWMFAPKWSAKVEYLYYNLGSVTNTLRPALVTTDAGVLSSASATSTTRFNGSVARVGINTHF